MTGLIRLDEWFASACNGWPGWERDETGKLVKITTLKSKVLIALHKSEARMCGKHYVYHHVTDDECDVFFEKRHDAGLFALEVM